jgi:hypothetical protein
VFIATVARVNSQCAIGIHVCMPSVVYKSSGRNGCYVDPMMVATAPFEHAHVVTSSEAEAELRHDEAAAAASARPSPAWSTASLARSLPKT